MSCSGCTKTGDALALPPQAGQETKIAGIDTYVTGEGEKALIIVTDIFGWRWKNMRGVADQVRADSGARSV